MYANMGTYRVSLVYTISIVHIYCFVIGDRVSLFNEMSRNVSKHPMKQNSGSSRGVHGIMGYPSPFPVLQYSLNCEHSALTFLPPML